MSRNQPISLSMELKCFLTMRFTGYDGAEAVGILITFYFKTIFLGRNIRKISLDHFNPVDFKETSNHSRHCWFKGGGMMRRCSFVFLKCRKNVPLTLFRSLVGPTGGKGWEHSCSHSFAPADNLILSPLSPLHSLPPLLARRSTTGLSCRSLGCSDLAGEPSTSTIAL